MSSIQTHGLPLHPRGQGLTDARGGAPDGTGEDFATRLAAAGEEMPEVVGVNGTGAQSTELRQALAQIFNSFGFFQPHSKAQPAPDVAYANGQMPGHSEQLPAAPKVASPESAPSLHRGQLHQAAAELLGQLDIPPTPDLRPRAQSNVHASATPAPAKGSAPIVYSAPSQPKAVASEQHTRHSRLENDPKYPGRPPTAVAKQQDRIIFRFGAHLVELIGKFEGLDVEEERQLLAKVGALLESHGLGLGSATINGLPLLRDRFGRMHQWR